MTYKSLLTTALLATVFAAPAALAQQAGADAAADAQAVAHADVPTAQLAERYAELAGSAEAAAQLVEQLRAGGADAAAMGYGEIDVALSMAEALVAAGAAANAEAALDAVLQHRADGLGYGEIAHQLDLDPGRLTGGATGIGLDAVGAGGAGAAIASEVAAGRVALGADAAGRAGAGLAIAEEAAAGRVAADIGATTSADVRGNATPARDVGADARINTRIGIDARGGATGLPVGTGRPLLPERPLRGIR
jgi:hypothetical protein